jgi:ATP-dependent RNA helicase RhlE
MSQPDIQPVAGFDELGLIPVLHGMLHKLNFAIPTPIQGKAIPIALTGQDVVGIAQTGTGKTLAFALPILNNLLTTQSRALILVPTRELAIQVEDNIRDLLKHLPAPIRTTCLIGGAPIYRQRQELSRKPQIIVATPGRLNDHLGQRNVELSQVKFLVLDEADRMLDMGFAPQIAQIGQHLPEDRQTMLFSATMSSEVAQIASAYLKNPIRVEVARSGTSAAQVSQEVCFIPVPAKFSVLQHLLKEEPGTVIVFSRTKHGAAKLTVQLNADGVRTAEIHANRSLGQRRHALDGFKDGRYRVLVATDIAARGIDVQDIALVVNYDLPDSAEDYVHRIGRTGRAGKSGKAVSLAAPDQLRQVEAIERLMQKELPLAPYSDPRPHSARPGAYSRQARPHRTGGYSSPRGGGYQGGGRPQSGGSSYSSQGGRSSFGDRGGDRRDDRRDGQTSGSNSGRPRSGGGYSGSSSQGRPPMKNQNRKLSFGKFS